MMKTVLLFTLKLSGGGAEKTVRRLAGYINSHDLGYKARICVIYDDPAYHDETDDVIVLSARSGPDTGKITRGLNVVRQIRELKQIKKDLNVDLCVSFLPGADRINILSDTGEHRIVSVRVKESYFTGSLFRKAEILKAYRKCDLIVAVSDYVRQDVLDFFGAPADKVVTVHNAIDDKTADGGSVTDTAPDIPADVRDFISGRTVFINVGRLDEQKGQDYLIKAFARVHEKHPDTVLMILGEGDLREYLQGLISELGCEDSVLPAGNVRNPEAYLAASDIFVLSSNVEGMPNVILEAMQAHLPCISTECGAREILAPDTDATYATDRVECAEYGVLIPIRDVESLVTSMNMLLEDTKLRDGYIEKDPECIKRFGPDVIFPEWIALFDRVTGTDNTIL